MTHDYNDFTSFSDISKIFFLRLIDKATRDFKLSPLNNLFAFITAKEQARIAQIC